MTLGTRCPLARICNPCYKLAPIQIGTSHHAIVARHLPRQPLQPNTE